MAFDLDNLFTDPKREEEGVWIDFYADSQLKIASTDSKAYKAELAEQARKHKLQLDLDQENEKYFDLIQELTCEALAKHVLKDWRNINIADQENVPYSPSLGKDLLMRSTKLRTFVEQAASDHTNFKAQVEEDAKNSSTGSSGGEEM
jgi:hypothetical protein